MCDMERTLEIISERIKELKEIRERERKHGITTKDEYILEGSISELELLMEKIKNEK